MTVNNSTLNSTESSQAVIRFRLVRLRTQTKLFLLSVNHQTGVFKLTSR